VPSVLYPLYAAQWRLNPIAETTIFAVYPLALVLTLLFFGGLSDVLGRRLSLLAGVILIALGGLAFVIAPNEAWLYIGRIFAGAGTGISVGAASAALVDFNRGIPSRASAVNTLGSSVGLLGACVISGALVQYAPAPTRLSFVVLIAVAVLLAILVALMPQHDKFDEQPRTVRRSWRPRPIGVPAGTRLSFTVAALGIFTGLGLGSIILSLGAQISKDLIHTDNVFVQGLILAISSAMIGVVAFAFRPIPPRISIAVAGASGVAALAAIVPSSLVHSMPLYIASQILGGAALGLAVLGGIGLLQREAPAHHRASLISAFFLVGYVGQGLVSVLSGTAATAWGLQSAIAAFSIGLGILGLMVIAAAAFIRPHTAAVPLEMERLLLPDFREEDSEEH
jgi:MFS family permease